MSNAMPNEDYTRKQALRIHDESVSFGRQVHSTVWLTAMVLAVLAVFTGFFMLTQTLQRGGPASTHSDVAIMPATGPTLTTAFTALLAVIIAIWFSPNAFRLGNSETPATIARELATREIASRIARLCVLASLAVAFWAFVSAVVRTEPQHVDMIRLVGPSLLGLGLAYWAAAADVRIAADNNQMLRWAGLHREVKRLKSTIRREDVSPLSKRERIVQSIIVFGAVPVLVWRIGLWIAPAPNPGTTFARLVAAVIVAVVGFFALREIRYQMLGRRILAVGGFVTILVFVGAMLSLTAVSGVLLEAASKDALELAPVGQGVLTFTLITLSGPFFLLALFTARRLFFGRPGLIFDSVRRRYSKELNSARERRIAAKPRSAGQPQNESKVPYAWEGVAAALLPVPPFNFMLIVQAFKRTREGSARGRRAAWLAVVIGVIALVLGVGLLLVVIFAEPRLVICNKDALCLA